MTYRDAEFKHMDELFAKLGGDDDPGNVGTNINEATKGVNPEQYKDESDKGQGMDAPWSKEPGATSHGQQPVVHVSNPVLRAFREGREELLGKLLDAKAPSDKAEQATVSALLTAASKGDFETSSPQLSEKSKMSSVPEHETLLQQVRRITGQY
jgi:hypothetical protein